MQLLPSRLLLLTSCVIVLSGCIQSERSQMISTLETVPTASSSPGLISLGSSEEAVIVPVTARFEITTNGTKRIFTNSKYHNQSLDVYLTSDDSSVVNVVKNGITWGDFFKTLPFSLSKDCLITGTRQTFCTNDSKALRFYLNGEESPMALDMPIDQGSFLEVIYK